MLVNGNRDTDIPLRLSDDTTQSGYGLPCMIQASVVIQYYQEISTTRIFRPTPRCCHLLDRCQRLHQFYIQLLIKRKVMNVFKRIVGHIQALSLGSPETTAVLGLDLRDI
jgi:hypothetical protein